MSHEMNAGKDGILVVDDEMLNRILLSTNLQESGYVVETAGDGQQALHMLRTRPFDAVLLDLIMPGMDGYQVCERIKADEQTHDIPVIFISALEEIGDKVRAFTVGGADYVTKFFQFEEVLARVETHLALRDLNQELERRLEELQARNEELDAFAHTVAHDLKNPLTAIIGYSTLLEIQRAQLPDEKIAHYLDTVAKSARKMTNIIEELLLLASVRRVEEVEMEPLDMAAIVAEVQERLADLIAEQRAQVLVPDDWPVALGRGPWVEEVWANYLSNAIKYGGCPDKGAPPRVQLGADPHLYQPTNPPTHDPLLGARQRSQPHARRAGPSVCAL
jgi:two-component system sensor histidine kinase/response regulator